MVDFSIFVHGTKILGLDFLSFLEFKVTDAVDILLVAALLYSVYKLVRGTVAVNIFVGIVMVWALWKLTELLQMTLMSNIVGGFMRIGLIALIIVFQQEIRRFLLVLGSTNFASKQNLIRRFKFLNPENLSVKTDVEAILGACQHMSATKTGALIVIERSSSLEFVKATGDVMSIKVTQPILESIFFKNSPLHDGAVIIQDNVITATRVILPVSSIRNIPLRYGLRHRAAADITESTDAVCLVVSEETGTISYLKNGEFVPYQNLEELMVRVKKDLE